MKTIVIKLNGLDDSDIQEEFTKFFNELNRKYTSFGAGISIMVEGTEGEKTILKIADLE